MVMATPLKVVLPPDEPPSPDSIKPGGWWHIADGGKIICDLCPRGCLLRSEGRGFCFVRQNLGGRMVTTTYGRSSGFCIDPIEKKPLNHFYPGTAVLSFGTAGCNLGCKFCQNWATSKSREIALAASVADPEDRGPGGQGFRLPERGVYLQRPGRLGRVCHRFRQGVPPVGVKTVAVTAGYITPRPARRSTR